MICRIWRGWTTHENADAYEQLLCSEIFQRIGGLGLPGYRGIELLRRREGDSTEFVTMMWFDALAGVRSFAGHDYERAVVPPEAQALLQRFDQRSAHYEVRQARDAGQGTR
jgi:antibiotic biosynthesis monooxygenase (ABM) superfamily enzyme